MPAIASPPTATSRSGPDNRRLHNREAWSSIAHNWAPSARRGSAAALDQHDLRRALETEQMGAPRLRASRATESFHSGARRPRAGPTRPQSGNRRPRAASWRPPGGRGDIRIGPGVARPEAPSGCGVGAVAIAGRAEGEHPAVAHLRRATRPGAGHRFEEPRSRSVQPDRVSARQPVGRHDLVVAARCSCVWMRPPLTAKEDQPGPTGRRHTSRPATSTSPSRSGRRRARCHRVGLAEARAATRPAGEQDRRPAQAPGPVGVDARAPAGRSRVRLARARTPIRSPRAAPPPRTRAAALQDSPSSARRKPK